MLSVFGKKPLSTKDIMEKISISPNELIEILRNLLRQGHIQEVSPRLSKGSRGRPKVYYQLTDKAKESMTEYKKLVGKAKKRYRS